MVTNAIEADATDIIIDITAVGDNIIFVVNDNGHGVKTDNFYANRGGIGIPLTMYFVECMGGQVKLGHPLHITQRINTTCITCPLPIYTFYDGATVTFTVRNMDPRQVTI